MKSNVTAFSTNWNAKTWKHITNLMEEADLQFNQATTSLPLSVYATQTLAPRTIFVDLKIIT